MTGARRLSTLLVKGAATLAVVAQTASAAPVPGADVAEPQLRALHHRLASAFFARDPAFVQSLVGDDFRMLAANGARVDRATFVADMTWPPALGGVSYDELRVRLYGPVALLHGVLEALDPNGRPLRRRTSDVYHWDGNGWRLVAAQQTPLREGSVKTLLRGTAPLHAGWTRNDPPGDDLSTLRRLNEQYVQAFRDANAPWHDAHLAPDYVVTNSDGSFVDRASALAAFARPSFATHFRSFPVDQVNIRRFGDVALIEAENAYELKDGRNGVSRYTDIWLKTDGRWRCISAHITPVKLP